VSSRLFDNVSPLFLYRTAKEWLVEDEVQLYPLG